jgi:Tol biopolymer transport system component
VDPVDGSLWFSVYDDSFDDQTIMFSRRTDSGWAAPEVAPFSGEWGDRAPRFSPNGSSLYFSSNRPMAGAESGTDMNLWRVVRIGNSWGHAKPLSYPANSGANDMHASVTNSALWLASTREGSLGRSDIYRIDQDGAVDQLSAPINDENSQPDLWVSADETWMILVITNHPDGYGGDDLYLSRYDGNAWSVPENLGSEINTDEYEYGPTVSPDGEYLYFTSHRGGSADVYRVRLSSVIE